MQPKNPDFVAEVKNYFAISNFMQYIGAQLTKVEAGWCEAEIILQAHHRQHNGVVHAGVQATLADNTAGAAAGTLIAPEENILTLEFKINLLRAAQGEKLLCRAQVLKAGSQFTIVESEVFMVTGEQMKLASKATVSLAILKKLPPF